MSIVRLDLADARALDLFAGSGALGLEALSRGAASADFVETHPRSLCALKANIEALAAGELAAVHRADALAFIERLGENAYDIAFADPPYRGGMAEAVATRWKAVPFAPVLGVEHAASETMPDGGDTRRYGDTAITFYRTE